MSFIRPYAAFLDEFAAADPFYCPPVQACVREPNQRLIDLLTQDEDLTPSQRHEVQILSGEEM